MLFMCIREIQINLIDDTVNTIGHWLLMSHLNGISSRCAVDSMWYCFFLPIKTSDLRLLLTRHNFSAMGSSYIYGNEWLWVLRSLPLLSQQFSALEPLIYTVVE